MLYFQPSKMKILVLKFIKIVYFDRKRSIWFYEVFFKIGPVLPVVVKNDLCVVQTRIVERHLVVANANVKLDSKWINIKSVWILTNVNLGWTIVVMDPFVKIYQAHINVNVQKVCKENIATKILMSAMINRNEFKFTKNWNRKRIFLLHRYWSLLPLSHSLFGGFFDELDETQSNPFFSKKFIISI